MVESDNVLCPLNVNNNFLTILRKECTVIKMRQSVKVLQWLFSMKRATELDIPLHKCNYTWVKSAMSGFWGNKIMMWWFKRKKSTFVIIILQQNIPFFFIPCILTKLSMCTSFITVSFVPENLNEYTQECPGGSVSGYLLSYSKVMEGDNLYKTLL